MVDLINIKKNNSILSANYYPEGEKSDIGEIKYDIEKKVVIDFKYCKRDENSFLKSYFKKAIHAIERIIEEGEYPTSYNYMWY